MNCWIWSTAFHARDVKLTERLDYYGAIIFVMYTTMMTIMFTMNITSKKSQYTVFLLSLIAIITHISYMQFISFDYGWNIKVLALSFASKFTCGAIWWLRNRKTKPHAYMSVTFEACLALAGLFEVLDFPPYLQIFDAHSIWHILTVPLGYYYYWMVMKEIEQYNTLYLHSRI